MRDRNIQNDPAYLFQYVMDIPDDSLDMMQREQKTAANINHYRANIIEQYSLSDNAGNTINDGDPILMGSIYNGERLWR